MVVIQDIVERESIEFQADAKTSDFFSIAMFCGIGLLVSLSVLLMQSELCARAVVSTRAFPRQKAARRLPLPCGRSSAETTGGRG
jgi:hypothetical protein